VSAAVAVSRIIEMAEYLSDYRFATYNGLADMFHVSVSTVMRDLDYVGMFVPVTTTQGRGGGISVDKDWHYNLRHFRKEEVETMLSAIALARQSGNTQLASKLEAILNIYKWRL